jgi:hypothetical protein
VQRRAFGRDLTRNQLAVVAQVYVEVAAGATGVLIMRLPVFTRSLITSLTKYWERHVPSRLGGELVYGLRGEVTRQRLMLPFFQRAELRIK